MRRKAITNFCAIPAALFLLLIGLVHSIVNVAGVRRAIERGEIAARLGDSVFVNAAFSGLAMSVLGLLVLLVLPGLRTGSRQAGRVATVIGVFVAVLGTAAYLWVPTRPLVLIFLFFGALLAAPLLIWRREFSNA
jgi:chromate transport protein ChrA